MKKGLLVSLVSLVCTSHVWAQGCAVCTKMAAGLDSKAAKGLNGGIVYLAFLPLACMGTIGFIWWKHNRAGQQ